MLYVRKSADRGYAEFGGWLRSFHTFSFAEYYDPRFMGYRDLRVINQDWIAPASGFPLHPHRDMEIITYVLKGTVEHRDSLGSVGQVSAGEIQTMHAGTGIRHSEYNPSQSEELQLFQIWILPDVVGAKPGYTQQSFSFAEKNNKFKLIASKDGRMGSQKINQDLNLYASIFSENFSADFQVRPGRGIWLQLAEGVLEVNGILLESGDALVAEGLDQLNIKAQKLTEFLIFDLK